MPFRIRKSGSKFLIQKREGGVWRTVGKSSNKRDAAISIKFREKGAGE